MRRARGRRPLRARIAAVRAVQIAADVPAASPLHALEGANMFPEDANSFSIPDLRIAAIPFMERARRQTKKLPIRNAPHSTGTVF